MSVEPKSSVAHFGIRRVGPTFQWGFTNDDGEYEEKEFRAHPGLVFEEVIQYTTIQAVIAARATFAQDTLTKQINAIAAGLDADGKYGAKPAVLAEDGVTVVHEAVPGHDPIDELEALAAQAAVDERLRWVEVQKQVLMLVSPHDRAEFEPLIAVANPVDARELRDHLQTIVIDRVKAEVAAAAGVDPT